MIHYYCRSLELNPSRNHVSNPHKCSSELSCQGTEQLGYLATDSFLSLCESCPWHFKVAVHVNEKVLEVKLCQLQVNSVVGFGDVQWKINNICYSNQSQF